MITVRKVIQVDEEDYNKLTKMATLTERQIEEMAEQMWRDNGVAKIQIEIGSRFNNATCSLEIWCSSSFFDKGGKFQLPYRLKNRFREIIDKEIMHCFNKVYGKPEEIAALYRENLERINRMRIYSILIAASGWAVATMFLCFTLYFK